MTYSEIASQSANLSVIIWGTFFFLNYLFFFIKYKKDKIKSFFYSGLSIVSFFIFLNIFSSNYAIFGGDSDRYLAHKSAGYFVYFIHFTYLFTLQVILFSNYRYAKFMIIPIAIIVFYLTKLYFAVNLFSLIIYLPIIILSLFFSRKFAKSEKIKTYLTILNKNKRIKYSLVILLFLWSLVWVFGFLYRNREVVFDCSIDAHRNEFLENLRPIRNAYGHYDYMVVEKASKVDRLFTSLGEPDNKKINYFKVRYSNEDVTYFYCPKPFLSLKANSCEGYRVTLANDGFVRDMQKRGLSCVNTKLSKAVNPLNDMVYFFYWSSDMLSLNFFPSEHYDMYRAKKLFFLNYE